jgi:hypothetical protein
MEKISMREKYYFPRRYLADAYLEICNRDHPLSIEEGKRIGVNALIMISQTREELRKHWRHWPKENRKQVVIHNLIELKPSFTFKIK